MDYIEQENGSKYIQIAVSDDVYDNLKRRGGNEKLERSINQAIARYLHSGKKEIKLQLD
jgi:predicted CopG family antitoxin